MMNEDKIEAWCQENNWTDPFYQEMKWWAFPPSAVMPIEVPKEVTGIDTRDLTMIFSLLETYFGESTILEAARLFSQQQYIADSLIPTPRMYSVKTSIDMMRAARRATDIYGCQIIDKSNANSIDDFIN